MDNQETFIQYSLADSRIGQAVREKGIEMAWLKIEFFIRQFTTALPENPDHSRWDSIELHIFSGFEDPKTDDKSWTAINLANEKFGEGQIINIQQPQLYENPPKKETIWRLTKETFKDAVNILTNGDPWPKQQLGPVELMFSYNFHLRDSRSKKIMDGLPFQSGIMFWLTRTSFCSPTLNFPFQNADDSFWNYVKEMEPYLPFKFDKKYLRLVTKNKKGTGFKSRKL